MSSSPVGSPLALYPANTRVTISSYRFRICFLGIEYYSGMKLSQEQNMFFIVRLSLIAPLHGNRKLFCMVYRIRVYNNRLDIQIQAFF